MHIRYWKQIIVTVALLSIMCSCSLKGDKQSSAVIQRPDLYAKTKGEGHVFLGVYVPFGSLQSGPQTSKTFESIGYNYNDSIITGFTLSYASEKDSIAIIKPEDAIRFFPSTQNEREAKFKHSYEVLKPGYYSVYMHEADIAVELTATKHVSFQRYFFPPEDSVQVFINRELSLVNDSILTGKTASTYFVAHFSRPPINILKNQHETILSFDTTDEEMLYIKVGISAQSTNEAESFIKEELPEWNFEQATIESGRIWNEYLTGN